MGWVIAIGFAALTWLSLYFSKRCSRLALELSAAILLVGLAGYGWQGSPDMSGTPVSHKAL
jgi:hypothetical protein